MSNQEMIRALLEAGFSGEAIAYATKVNKSTISRIATGKTNYPGDRLMNSIQEIFREYAAHK